MYARRNTITIAILWLLMLLIGIFWFRHESEDLDEIKGKNDTLKKQLDGSLEVVQALRTVEAEYEVLKDNWSRASKKVLATEEPSFSLYYLNWLVNNYNVELDFDFVLEGMAEDGDIATFTFTLTGEGPYREIYRLIWLITENPLLYHIESFVLRQKQDDDLLLDFKMQIKGFSLTDKAASDQEFNFASMRPINEVGFFHDAFRPLRPKFERKPKPSMFEKDIKKTKAKPVDEGLVNIQQSRLQAVANGKIYIKDKSGKLLALKLGEKVRFGKLSRINKKKSEAEFILNKDGVDKKVIMGLGYQK